MFLQLLRLGAGWPINLIHSSVVPEHNEIVFGLLPTKYFKSPLVPTVLPSALLHHILEYLYCSLVFFSLTSNSFEVCHLSCWVHMCV